MKHAIYSTFITLAYTHIIGKRALRDNIVVEQCIPLIVYAYLCTATIKIWCIVDEKFDFDRRLSNAQATKY